MGVHTHLIRDLPLETKGLTRHLDVWLRCQGGQSLKELDLPSTTHLVLETNNRAEPPITRIAILQGEPHDQANLSRSELLLSPYKRGGKAQNLGVVMKSSCVRSSCNRKVLCHAPIASRPRPVSLGRAPCRRHTGVGLALGPNGGPNGGPVEPEKATDEKGNLVKEAWEQVGWWGMFGGCGN